MCAFIGRKHNLTRARSDVVSASSRGAVWIAARAEKSAAADFVEQAGLGAAGAGRRGRDRRVSTLQAQQNAASAVPATWDFEADVVVIGSGACGLPAAIRAADHGASVLVVEANYDIGGHGIINGGQVPLGGGTSAQKKHGIVDSPDILFKDLTDWSVVETNGMPDYRYNDRGVQRALADNEAAAYEFLLENGVQFEDGPPGVQGGHAIGISAPRENYAEVDKGQSVESPAAAAAPSSTAPLENSAKKKGVRFLLNYHMDAIVRETPSSGRVLGIKASYTPKFLPGSTTPMRPFRSDGVIAIDGKDRHRQGEEGGDRRHRWQQQQRQLPPDVRRPVDRGVPGRGRALFLAGRERRARRHGDRRVAVGDGEPDARAKRRGPQAAGDRRAVHLSRVDAAESDLSSGPRHRPSRRATGRTSSS